MLRAAAALKSPSPSASASESGNGGGAGGGAGPSEAVEERTIWADYVAFDMDPVRVKAGKKRGFNVKYGCVLGAG